MRKGQTELFEYVIATFFIVIILVFVILMLSSYQTSQLELEQQKIKDLKTMASLKRFLSTSILSKDDSLLDDSKLTAALGMCKDMEEFFGNKWYAEVRILEGQEIRCTPGEYTTNCNYWVFCEENKQGDESSYTVPVNVMRKMFWVTNRGTNSRTYPAIVEVGIYE